MDAGLLNQKVVLTLEFLSCISPPPPPDLLCKYIF